MPLKTRLCFVQLFKLVYRSTKEEEEEEKRNRLFRVPSDFQSTPFSCQISIPFLFIGDSMWTACEVWHSTVFVPRKKWTCLYYFLAAQALTTLSRKTRRGVELGAKMRYDSYWNSKFLRYLTTLKLQKKVSPPSFSLHFCFPPPLP